MMTSLRLGSMVFAAPPAAPSGRIRAHLALVSKDATAKGQRPSDPELVFREHASYVGRIALRLLGRGGDVDDVVQDVFVEATRGLGALRDPEAVRGWLAAVTVRVATRKLRAQRLRQWVGIEELPSYAALQAPGASAEQRLLLSQVYRTLERVSVNARVAWLLRYVEGERLETVAQRCGCSLAAAKRRILLAEQKIAEVFSL